MTKDLSGFSNRLSYLIYDKKLSQADVCRMAGISKQSLAHYLSGTRMPRADVIISLAEILGVSVKYLLTGKEENKIIDAEGLTSSQIQLLKDYATFFKEYNKLIYEHDKIIKRVNDSTEQLKLLSKQLSEERNVYFAELEKRKKALEEASSTAPDNSSATPSVVSITKKVSSKDIKDRLAKLLNSDTDEYVLIISSSDQKQPIIKALNSQDVTNFEKKIIELLKQKKSAKHLSDSDSTEES